MCIKFCPQLWRVYNHPILRPWLVQHFILSSGYMTKAVMNIFSPLFNHMHYFILHCFSKYALFLSHGSLFPLPTWNFSYHKTHLLHTSTHSQISSSHTLTLIIVSISLLSPTHSPGVTSIFISVREVLGCVLSSGHSVPLFHFSIGCFFISHRWLLCLLDPPIGLIFGTKGSTCFCILGVYGDL